MMLLVQIQAFTSMDSVVGPSHKHSPHPRQRTKTHTLMHAGKRVCRETFLALHAIGIHETILLACYSNLSSFFFLGRSRFQAMREHYAASGLETRTHGNLKRLPSNSLTHHERENAVRFIRGYSRANSILLPGRIPGYKKDDLQLLPSSTTKKVCA